MNYLPQTTTAARLWSLLVLGVSFGFSGCDREEAVVESNDEEEDQEVALPIVEEIEPNDSVEGATRPSAGNITSGTVTGRDVDFIDIRETRRAGYGLVATEGTPDIFGHTGSMRFLWDSSRLTELNDLSELESYGATHVELSGTGRWELRPLTDVSGEARERDDATCEGLPVERANAVQVAGEIRERVFCFGREGSLTVGDDDESLSGVVRISIATPGLSSDVGVTVRGARASWEQVLTIPNNDRLSFLWSIDRGGELSIGSVDGCEAQSCRLQISVEPAVAAREGVEPDDSEARANRLNADDEHGESRLLSSSDVDYWAIHAATDNAVLHLTVLATEGEDAPELAIEGADLAAEADDGRRTVCTIHAADVAQPTIVRVASAGGDDASGQAYSVEVRDWTRDDFEIEPNDDFPLQFEVKPTSDATHFVIPGRETAQTLRGVVGTSEDPVDIFAVHIVGEREFNATKLVLLPGAGSDVNLELLDAEHVTVARSDNGGVAEREEINVELPSGLYFVRIAHGGGESCVVYQLTVSSDDETRNGESGNPQPGSGGPDGSAETDSPAVGDENDRFDGESVEDTTRPGRTPPPLAPPE